MDARALTARLQFIEELRHEILTDADEAQRIRRLPDDLVARLSCISRRTPLRSRICGASSANWRTFVRYTSRNSESVATSLCKCG